MFAIANKFYEGALGVGASFQYAMKNPFGLDFKVSGKEIDVTFGSAINCLGYNDHLEKIIGFARLCFGVIAAVFSEKREDKVIATGHIIRGFAELNGSCELYLLILDCAFTVYNIAKKILFPSKQNSPATS